jgi:adenine-specific DNA-methyltransferase
MTYTAHRNTIINGDCINILPQLDAGSIDFVLTDPPYVLRYKLRDGRTVPNDNFVWLNPSFAEMFRVLKHDSFCVSFYGWPNAGKFVTAFLDAGFRIVGHFVFPKPYTSGTGLVRYQHECAYLLAKGRPTPCAEPIGDVIPWKTYTHNKYHPTQKPLGILKPLIEAFTVPGDLVLDPFSGSGSSLLAAKMLGRSWLGIELDAKYHAIATERLELARAA